MKVIETSSSFTRPADTMKHLLLMAIFLLFSTQAMAANYTDVIDDNEVVCISPKIKNNDITWAATIIADGDFGGGTITWSVKIGSSYIDMKDLTGVTKTSTADDIFNIELGKAGYSGTDLIICSTMAGATSPSVNVYAYDNN